MESSLPKLTIRSALKNIRTHEQLKYLKNARIQKFLPRGIAEQMKYVSAIHDIPLQNSIQELMNFCGSRILDLLIIYYTTWNNNTRASYYSNLAKIKDFLPPDQFQIFESNLASRVRKERTSISKTHTNKLARDSNKIKVPYKDVTDNKLPSHLSKNIKVNVKRKNRRMKKKKRHHRNKPRTIIKGDKHKLEDIPIEKLEATVINLSKKIPNLTRHQLYLFYLGESFAPTPPLPDYSKFRLDILQFAYRLRWAWHWHQNPPKSQLLEENPKFEAIKTIERKLATKTDTKPIQHCNNPCLELFIQKVTKELLQANTKRTSVLPDNLPEETRKALEDMKSWRDTVIRLPDKGSKFFVIDREDLVERTLAHLQDISTFVAIEDKTMGINEAKIAIQDWCIKYANEEGMTTEIVSAILDHEECKPGNNYLFMKAHKPEQNYPSRLISTGCASFTRNISHLTAIELSKVELPYVMKDINHFLSKIQEVNNSNIIGGQEIIHVSFDVVSMFPSISKEVGLEQCRMHLNKRTDPLYSTDCILDALNITLSNNLTVFENIMYKQIKGTAMGPKNACIYADVAMNSIDVMVNEGDWNPEYRPLLWARSRDDVYVPWTYGFEMLEVFHEWLNSRMIGITFTKKFSLHGTEHLNTFVYNSLDNKIQTKPFSKPCDEHTYLVPSSCHPAHNIRNIPYGIAHTIYKISSEKHEYEKSKAEYTEHLKARGYSIGIIHEAFNKVETRDRLSFLSPKLKQSKEERVYPLVTDFNPGLPNIGAVLNKHKHILNLDSELVKVISPKSIFASYRGAKTIKDILIHSKLPMLKDDEKVESPILIHSDGCKPCSKGCILCKNYLVKTTHAYSYHTNSKFRINGVVDCNSENVVYIINDKVCKISSVGYTKINMSSRFTNHKSHIKHNKRTCEVSKHFADNEFIHVLDKSTQNNYDTSLKSQIEVIIVEKVDISKVGADIESIRKKLKEREWYWQNNLKTLRQYGGLNVREERS